MHLHSEAKAKKATDSTDLLILIKSAKSVEIETWHYGTISILWLKHFAVRNGMKILSAVICFSVLCLTFNAAAADDPVSFSGTWVLDSKESDPAPRPVMSLGADVAGRGGGGGDGWPGRWRWHGWPGRWLVAGAVAWEARAVVVVKVSEHAEASQVNPANRLPWS